MSSTSSSSRRLAPLDDTDSPSTSPIPPSESEVDELVELHLKLATHPVHPSPSSHTVSCRPSSSILQLKQQLFQQWDGKPKPEGITVIKGGRVCRDSESIDQVFEDELSVKPRSELILHVVVRASCWSAPFTEPPPLPPPLPVPPPPVPTINTIPPSPPKEDSSSSPYSPSYVSPIPNDPHLPTEQTSPSPNSLPSASSAPPTASTTLNNPYIVYLGHLQRLIPIQRSLLLLNLQKAHHYYQLQHQLRLERVRSSTTPDDKGKEVGEEQEVEGELGEVESLLKECGLWALVRNREEEVEKAYMDEDRERTEGVPDEAQEFKVVQLDGLPYLVHTPPALLHRHQSRTRPSLRLSLSVTRAEAILKILTTMLQLLITFQPTSPSIAHGRALVSRSSAQLGGNNSITGGGGGGGAAADTLAVLAALGGAGGGPNPPQQPLNVAHALQQHHQHRQVQRRAATISITLHLDSLVQFLVPLFFLSLKLAFLLFVFARHASPGKRYVLIGLAVGWVLWEGVRIARRGRRPAGVGVAPGVQGGGAGGERGARERERGERERRRLARDLANQAREVQAVDDARRQPPQQVLAPAGGEGGAGRIVPGAVQNGGIEPPAQHRRRRTPPASPPSTPSANYRRNPPSVFSPKYWINALAAVGLVSEARELGLSPRYIAGRPISPPRSSRRGTGANGTLTRWERQKDELRRLGRSVWIGSVLFFATLIPEIERKRKKALEKRDRLLAEKKVRWEKEKEKEEREKGEREKQLQGRQKVSDAELFSDGTGDAFTLQSPSTIGDALAPAHASTSGPSASTSTPQVPGNTNLSPSLVPPAHPSEEPDSGATTPREGEDDLSLSLTDEGDGDIAASASVSDGSDNEEGAGAPQEPQAAEVDGEGEGEGGLVAIF